MGCCNCGWPSGGGGGGVSANSAEIFIPADDFAGVNATLADIVSGNVSIRQLPFNDVGTSYATAYFAMPKNWDSGAVVTRIYWFVNAEGSHGVAVDWEIGLQALGDAEANLFTLPTLVANSDTEAANDTLYITPEVTFNPVPSTGGVNPEDWIKVVVHRANDAASGEARLLGVKFRYSIDPSIVV